MMFVYLAALLLGGGMFVLFTALLFGADGEGRFPLKGLVLAGMGLVCAVYSIKQLLLPVPRRVQPRGDD